jgi:hypothetical protein
MKAVLASLALAAGLAVASTAQAVVVFQDGFEGEPAGSQLNYNAFANWDVLNGTVDKIAQGGFGLACAGGSGICVDMDGSTNNAGDLVSKAAFSFAAGDTVRLTFDFSGNQRGGAADGMTVSFGALFSELFGAVPANQPYQTVVRTFAAVSAGTANISFSHAGGDNIGMMLDNVKLEVEPVPVPAPVLLMGSVLGLAAWRARRSRKAATA